MTDRHVAVERLQLLLVEHLRDESGLAQRRDVAALAGGNAGRLLPAMLERVEREVGEARDVMPRRVDAEDSTFIARTVALVERRLNQVGQRNRTPGSIGRTAGAPVPPAKASNGRGSRRPAIAPSRASEPDQASSAATAILTVNGLHQRTT